MLFLRYRRVLIIGFHIFLIALANYLAFLIRFEGQIPDSEIKIFIDMLPWLILIRGLSLLRWRLYQGLWR